jgi:cell wall-associated NlpC family hydrolase
MRERISGIGAVWKVATGVVLVASAVVIVTAVDSHGATASRPTAPATTSRSTAASTPADYTAGTAAPATVASHPATAPVTAAAVHAAAVLPAAEGDFAVRYAASQAGVAYCNGGGGIDGKSSAPGCSAPGFSCMSLAQYAVYQASGQLVADSGPQPGTVVPTGSSMTSNLEPGDVVFFGGGWHDIPSYAHSGIYAGNDEVWDALDSTHPVQEHTMEYLAQQYGGNFDGAVRFRSAGPWTPPIALPSSGVGVPIPSSGGNGHGYDLVGSDGGVFVFGGGFYGSLPGLGVHVDDITGIVPTTTDTGYFLVGADGGVFSFHAPFANSLPGIGVHVDDIVGIVPTVDDRGYFLVGADGGVFSFHAPFANSLPGIGVHVDDITGLAATPDDRGYWLVGSNGDVYAFGDAHYLGNAPAGAVGITVTKDGRGYWVVGADGSVTAYGDAGNFGDLPSLGVGVTDIVGIVVSADSRGYNLIGRDGGVFSFGDALNKGSLPGLGVQVSDVVGAVPT